ncbi:MAG: hypothetical protein ABSH52_07320 [Terriglobia bacterium]|jgi:hypothetical protein
MDSLPVKSRLLLAALSIWLLAVPPVKGQEPLSAADAEQVGRIFDLERSPLPLHCSIQPQKPMLDFAFRFDVGYIISCSLSTFEGRATDVFVYARITPQGGRPLLFGEDYRLPEATDVTRHRQLKQDFQMSGGLAVGEGIYQVEVLVMDQRTARTSRKRWLARVGHAGEKRAVQLAVSPGSVIPMGVRPWPITLDKSGKGLRLTVLLDAAPLNPRTPALRAWDRAFLLGSLSTLLRQIPCDSVRLRAFNLEQQRELFRRDELDDAGFLQLAASLRTLELGTVSYRVLQQRQGWLELLLNYANQELTAHDPADAVIILGPRSRYSADVPRAGLKERETPNPRFFYFEYFPGAFQTGQPPDVLSSLTKRLDGTVCAIFSPGDLARCVQKTLARVRPRTEPSTPSRWPARPAPQN